LLRDYDIRPVVVHPTKRADFSRHGYRSNRRFLKALNQHQNQSLVP
jgi:hypothetical protein